MSAAAGDLVVQWFGDIALNNLYCAPQHQAALARNLAEVGATIGPADLRVGNLETPLWGDGGENLLKVPRLCTSEDALAGLLPLGLNVALLANNHAYDCLEAGFEHTTQALDRHGIRWLGAGRTALQAAEPLILEVGGRRLGLLNYVDASTHPNVPPGAGVSLNMLEPQRVLKEVGQLAARVELVLVNLHWGVDLIQYPSPEQRAFARLLVERGARLVVGHHAHCLQSDEPWADGHIFYGIGEFLFDEVDYSRPSPEPCREGGVAVARVGAEGSVRAELMHVYRRGLLVELDHRSHRLRDQNRRNAPLSLPDPEYRKFFEGRLRHHRRVVAPLRFLSNSGGIIGTLRRLRWSHLGKLRQAILGQGT